MELNGVEMKRNISHLCLALAITALILLVGCEIPSPNSVEPVPVDANPIVVPQNPPASGEGEGGTDANVSTDATTTDEGDAGADTTTDADPNASTTGSEGDGAASTEGEAPAAAENPTAEGDAAADDGGEGTGATAEEESPRPAEEVPTTAPPAVEAPPENGIYVIQAGDTLGQIAERYGLTLDELAAANGIFNPNAISQGQEIRIPTPGEVVEEADAAAEETPAQGETVYVVQAGDTFFSIAQRFGFTVQELQTYNNIVDPTRIDVGQEIRIPAQ